jgi:hypothetical protein
MYAVLCAAAWSLILSTTHNIANSCMCRHPYVHREAQKRERARQLELASAGQKGLRGRLQDKRARTKEQLIGTCLLVLPCAELCLLLY